MEYIVYLIWYNLKMINHNNDYIMTDNKKMYVFTLQECIAETKDWRQCQNHVKAFKECMDKYKKISSK